MGRPKTKQVLTTAQALELKWFCENVLGVHMDFYAVEAKVCEFSARLQRLEKTALLVEKFLGKPIEARTSAFDEKKISAMDKIKAYRAKHDVGLKEAVDALRKRGDLHDN